MAGEALRIREIRILAKSQDRWIKIDLSQENIEGIAGLHAESGKNLFSFFNRSAGTRALKRTEFDMAQKCSFMLAKSNGFNLHYPSRSGLKTMLNFGFWSLNGGLADEEPLQRTLNCGLSQRLQQGGWRG